VVELKVDEHVFVANKNRIAARRGYKDQDKWDGPFRIIELTESTAVLEGTKHHINRHFLRLHKGKPLSPPKAKQSRK
jgi:hypothetical protein